MDFDTSHLDNVDWGKDSDPFGIFASKGIPVPKQPSPEEVQREATQRSRNIFANYHTLRAILQRHEARIQNRWEKKTRTQRLAILLQAWPGMAPTHRPDFAAFRRKSNPPTSNQASQDQDRESYLWPYINQEDLTKPKLLLLLLNARGRNNPSAFAASDGESMHLGKVTMSVVPIFLNCYVMLLNGMTRQEDYGKVMDWDDHEDAFEWMHKQKQFLPGEGLLILEAQDRLLEFLVSCCHKILHDIPPNDLTSDLYAVQPEPEPKWNKDVSQVTSLAAMAEETPYRLPAKLDLGRIESLLAARTARAEDHIWALREDPSYFAETLYERLEHRTEIINDTRGQVHPTLKPPREGLLWARVIGNVLSGSYIPLELYSEVHHRSQHLRRLQEKFESQLSPLDDLPEEYLVALLRFRHYLKQLARGNLSELKTAVVASPPFRPYFVRGVPASVSSSAMEIMIRPGMEMDKVTTELFWLLKTLWEDGDDLFLCRFPDVVDELDRLIKSEPRAAELVSSFVADLIGELSIVAECLKQIDNYQPWSNGFENALVDREEEIKREFLGHSETDRKMLGAFQEANLTSISQFGDPSDKKFEYPIGKKRNRANVQKLREAEENLDIFWDRIDRLVQAKVGDLHGTRLRRLLSQPRLLQRTPEWIEPEAKANKKPKSHVDQQNVDAILKPLSALYLEPEPASVRKETLAAAVSKSKAKTRGIPSAVSPNNEAAVLVENPADPQPELRVDVRTMKVFRIVFFDPATNATPGEIAWNDFLHAMVSTGFASEKLYGSVWQFKPTNLDVERPIQFHEPHPRGKIPFLVARRHGRRLNRAYGWFSGMFVLKD